MAEDVGVKKYIDFSYLLTGLLFAWLFVRLCDSIWNWLELPNPELVADIGLTTAIGVTIGVGGTIYLRLNQRIYGLVTECGVELRKTIWPGWDSTKSNTIVVIIVTLILGFILWAFDLTWKTLTNLVL